MKSPSEKSTTNRLNRTHNSNATFHSYSLLHDFERLMHLISLLLRYPGVGTLHLDKPNLIKDILGAEHTFATSLEEICAILAKEIDPIYAEPQKIAQDLVWLETNGLIGDYPQDQKLVINTFPASTAQDIEAHSYADLDPFDRLIKTIRFILHQPHLLRTNKPLDDNKLGSLKTLMTQMQAHQVMDSSYSESVRKDFEKVLKPFGILPPYPMKRGYFLGTAILPKEELAQVLNLLAPQAKSLRDPVALALYKRFEEHLSYFQIAEVKAYPVRAIGNETIVDSESLPTESLALKVEELEEAIFAGKLVELNRLRGVGRYTPTPEPPFLAYPLQIMFYNIAWYLGFERKDNGLFGFERLDRLYFGHPQTETRDLPTQKNSLKTLQQLYQSSAGIYLGYNQQQQQDYLSKNKHKLAAAQITVEMWCNDNIFRFISEGTNRFPLNQLKMSPRIHDHFKRKTSPFTLKQTEDAVFPHRFQVTLPLWSLDDFELFRWIIGFGAQVKVVQPPQLIEKIQNAAKAISALYPSGE